MSLNNKNKDFTPFHISRKPVKQFIPLAGLMWIITAIMTRGMKIHKKGLKGVKPPFLVIATHQGFSDYYILPRVLFPYRANYVSDMEGFAAFGDSLYHHIGCIGKRRYVSDINVVKNIKYALNTLKQPVVIFPESRHSDIGITSNLPKNLGKLAKLMDVPVVTVTNHGSYLANPFWDEETSRKVRLESNIELLFTKEDVQNLSEELLQKGLEEKLSYDEYKWQYDNKIVINHKNLAKGLHLPLYKCMLCDVEGKMTSFGDTLKCEACNNAFVMNEYGQLIHQSSNKILHAPDWYNSERLSVNKEIDCGKYSGIDVPVEIEALPNEKGFIHLKKGRLKHDINGFTLSLDDNSLDTFDTFPLIIKNKDLESVQTEYNYRNKGKCIVLSTKNCCYYVYSKAPEFIVTKLEFAVEHISS